MTLEGLRGSTVDRFHEVLLPAYGRVRRAEVEVDAATVAWEARAPGVEERLMKAVAEKDELDINP